MAVHHRHRGVARVGLVVVQQRPVLYPAAEGAPVPRPLKGGHVLEQQRLGLKGQLVRRKHPFLARQKIVHVGHAVLAAYAGPLAHPVQHQFQRQRAAQSVPVGIYVGDDGDMVPLPQPLGQLSYPRHEYSAPLVCG